MLRRPRDFGILLSVARADEYDLVLRGRFIDQATLDARRAGDQKT